MLCCLSNNKKTHIQLQTAKKLINKWPCGLGPKESSPFHLAPAGPINPFPFCQSCPASPAENRARGSCLGKRMCHRKSPPENSEGRGMAEGKWRDSSIASTTQRDHCKHNKGEGLAHASMTQKEACKVHFQWESSKLTQPWQRPAILPHLECTVSSSSFSKHLSELFLQVKLHRSKVKSGDRTRRSILTPHLIKHPIHNRLH